MNKYIKYILLGFFICLQACSFQDESLPDGEFNEANEFDLMTGAMTQLAYNQSALTGRTVGVLMYYFLPQDARVRFYNFNFGSDYVDDMWVTGYYGGSLASANEMRRLANESANTNTEAISLILMAIEFSNLSNMFGDIPFTEAVMGNKNVTPNYETQEEVYQGILRLLDDAIALIGSNGAEGSLVQSDLIFQGDMQRWQKLAYGLKARLLLNQRNKVPGMEAEILTLIDQSFNSREEQATFKHTALRENPLYTFGDNRPGTLFNHEFFVDILQSDDDPRIDAYTFSDFPDWEFHGEPQLVWSQFDANIPILSFTELMFAKTEVLFHTGAPTNEIESSLREAIISNLKDNEFNVDDFDTFIDSASDLSSLDDEEILQKIIEQAYLSYYGYNFLQSWNNYRRTGYPKLPELDDTIRENNPSNVIPKRMRYPQNEKDYNATNVEQAIARQNGDFLDDGIWIFE